MNTCPPERPRDTGGAHPSTMPDSKRYTIIAFDDNTEEVKGLLSLLPLPQILELKSLEIEAVPLHALGHQALIK